MGDVTKDIKLNGTVGVCEFNNESYHAILIGLDHNMDLETGGKHNAAFQFGQNDDGVNIAFIDSNYGTISSAFRMSTGNVNTGGWESSYMRNTICPEFFEALPNDWQNIIGTTVKYTDNVGKGSGDLEENVTATKDQIFILNFYEYGLTANSANSYEADFTKPYDEMYSSNSDRIKYRSTDPNSTSVWWGRSPYKTATNSFLGINGSGTNNYYTASYSYGFAPCFTVIADNEGVKP